MTLRPMATAAAAMVEDVFTAALQHLAHALVRRKLVGAVRAVQVAPPPSRPTALPSGGLSCGACAPRPRSRGPGN
jgi:hypothetical protein